VIARTIGPKASRRGHVAATASGRLTPKFDETFRSGHGEPSLDVDTRSQAFHEFLEPTLERELKMKGILSENGSFTAELIGLIEIV
jgi:hypothetical protein